MRIGHYMTNMFEPGGIAAYIRRVSEAQRASAHEVFLFDCAIDGQRTDANLIYTADDTDLLRRAVDLKLDVLHLHTTIDADAISTAGVPLVRTVHTHAPYCPSQGRFLKRPGAACDRAYSVLGCAWGHVVNRCGSVRPAALRRNFRGVRQDLAGLPQIRTIAVSQFIKDQMVRNGYPAGRIDVLYLPAPEIKDLNSPPPAGPPIFVYLGRMIPHKGVDWLLRAVPRLRTDARVELGGTGNQEQEYRALAGRLNLGRRANFNGWLDAEAATGLLHQARALVFPSIWPEPGGTVALEAMAAAKPVIMSRVGGMPEVVEHEVTGLLVEPGDVDGLARAIDRLTVERELAERLGDAGRGRVLERYTLAAHVDRLTSVYERAATTWHGRPAHDSVHTVRDAKISVIIPTHRRPDLLRKTLESLESQTHRHDRFDVTVVATSGDGASNVVDELTSRGRLDVRCVCIPDDPWQGRSAAAKRNYGAKVTAGEWIAFIDDDCVADSNWLAAAAPLFADPRAGAVEGRKVIPEPQHKTLTYKGLLLFTKPGGYQTCNMFYRRDVFDRVGGFDPRFPFYLEDSDLAWSVLDAGHTIPFAESAIVSHPVTEGRPWRMLDDARRAVLMPYLYRKHRRQYRRSGTRVLRGSHWLYLALYAGAIASLAMGRGWLAGALGAALVLLAALHVCRQFAGCRFSAREFVVTALLTPIVPVVKFAQLVLGNLRHRTWLWT